MLVVVKRQGPVEVRLCQRASRSPAAAGIRVENVLKTPALGVCPVDVPLT
jgi:hypothetical protein